MGEKLRTDDLGNVECIDEETGKVLWRQKGARDVLLKNGKKRGRIPRDAEPKTIKVIDPNSGKPIEVPAGFNTDYLPHTIYAFSNSFAAAICDQIIQGKTVEEIGRMEGFPPAQTIRNWEVKYPEFKAAVKEARIARGGFYHDKLWEIARDVKEGNHKSAKVKADILKWLASVADPQSYGQKVTHEGNADKPIAFHVVTGVIREGDQAIPVESTPIEDPECNSTG